MSAIPASPVSRSSWLVGSSASSEALGLVAQPHRVEQVARLGAPPATYNAGDLSTYYFTTTSCDTSARPVTWSFLAGHIRWG